MSTDGGTEQPAGSRPGGGGQPLVSVVIPTFNRSGLLREALASALEQTHTSLEVLVSDNGSTDDTADVVASFGDPRVQYLPLESNIGMIPNLDRCLRLGTAPYVMMLHDDDIMRPRNVEVKLALLESHPGAVFAHSAMCFIDAAGHVTHEHVEWGPPIDPVEDSATFIRRVFSTCNRVSPSGTLVRRRALGDIHYEAEDKAGNDMGLWLRLARKGAVVYSDEPLVEVRQHASSLTAASGLRTLEAGEDYAVTFDAAVGLRLVLDRFADRFADDPVPGRNLRTLARKSTAANLALSIRQQLGPEPRRGDLLRLFAEAVRIEPTFPFSVDGAELLATVAAGSSGAKFVQQAVPRLRSARSRLQSTARSSA